MAPGAGGRGGAGRLDTGGRGAPGVAVPGGRSAAAGRSITGAGFGAAGASAAGAGFSTGATGPDVGSTADAGGVATSAATGAGAASTASLFFDAPFFFGSGCGSSGCWSRTRPSRSAFRRTRSACASTMLDEWLFTPMPSAWHKSSVSLLVSPSSRANSYTRIFAGKSVLCPLLCLARRVALHQLPTRVETWAGDVAGATDRSPQTFSIFARSGRIARSH